MTDAQYVLGINPWTHDSAAALLCDGVPIVVAEQERFSRRKRALHEPPVDAIAYCLDYANLKVGDLSRIAVSYDIAQLAAWLRHPSPEMRAILSYADPGRLFPRDRFGAAPPRIAATRHHLAHAWSAYGASGFDRAAVLVADNRGEDISTSIWLGQGNKLTCLRSFGQESSLGLYYRAATIYAGLYGPGGDAGRFMGLAAYGSPQGPVGLAVRKGEPEFLGFDPPEVEYGEKLGVFRTEQLLRCFADRCWPWAARSLEDPVIMYADFAATVQRTLEEAMLALAGEAVSLTGVRSLAMAGGVALNCSANGKLTNSGLVDEMFVQPMAHDAGTALGCALAHHFKQSDASKDWKMTSAFLGPGLDDSEVAEAVTTSGLAARKMTMLELATIAAGDLANGRVVAWCRGRAEVGPRALGARSLLGDPRSRTTNGRLNTIKRREVWRPLAPSVLSEQFSAVFEGVPNQYMIVATSVRTDWKRRIPAAVHADGTARPQIVDGECTNGFRDLIQAFFALTGVPAVINTSLNREDEPMVHTARDALAIFLDREIDTLIVGDYIIRRDESRR